MALIVGGVTVTGTQVLDATKLSGNLPALDGSSLTSVSASASGQNGNTVGSYTLAKRTNTSLAKFGTVSAGQFYHGTSVTNAEKGNIYSGTWRNMCGLLNTGEGALYQRQS